MEGRREAIGGEFLKVPYLSATRLKMLKDCSFAYQCHYDPDNSASPHDARALKKAANHPSRTGAARLGNVIHGALEDWRRPDPETGKVPKPKFGALMSHYETWASKPEFTVDLDLYEDGKEVLRRWFDRRGREPVRVIAVEQKIGEAAFTPHILDNGVPIFGFIDLIVEHKDGTIELIDYKSNRAPKSQGEADSDPQAGIYLAYARERWPDRPLLFTFEMLRFGCVTTRWSDSKISEFKAWLKTKFDAALALTEPTATIGDACKWCAFSAICPEAQRLQQVGAFDLILSEWDNDDEMLDNLATIKAGKALLERAQKKIEGELRTRAELDPTRPAEERTITTNRWQVRLDDSTRDEYVPHEIQRLVPPAVFGQMASVTKTSVEKALPILPEDVARAVRATKVTKPTTRLKVEPRPDES